MTKPNLNGAVLLQQRCNVYGAENDGGAERLLGGLSSSAPSRQWYCSNVSEGRFRMECEHGHRGQVMPLCRKHFQQYSHSVTFCPRCNMEPPGHKCDLVIRAVS